MKDGLPNIRYKTQERDTIRREDIVRNAWHSAHHDKGGTLKDDATDDFGLLELAEQKAK